MEDILLIEYLREKGILSEREYSNLTSGMKDEVVTHSHLNDSKADKYSEFFSNFKEVTKDMNPSEKGQFVARLKEYGNKPTEHFNETYAKYIVSKMWHKDNMGRKYIGEKFDIMMAKETCERYRGIVPSSITYSDIYIAINSHYHDYSCLFKKWFGNDIDQKIIESAIVFWFKDEDYGPSKLWNHFKDN